MYSFPNWVILGCFELVLGDEFRPVWWEGTEEYAVNPGKVRSVIF